MRFEVGDDVWWTEPTWWPGNEIRTAKVHGVVIGLVKSRPDAVIRVVFDVRTRIVWQTALDQVVPISKLNHSNPLVRLAREA